MTAIAEPLKATFSLPTIRWETLQRHSDLVTGLARFALNSCILGEKALPRMPPLLGSGAQMILSYTGLWSIPSQTLMIEKGWSDLTRCHTVGEWEGVAALALKVSSMSVDLFLQIAGCAVAVAKVAGQTTLVACYYHYITPIALASLAAAIALDFYRPAEKKELSETVLALEQSGDKRIEALFRELAAENTPLASEIIRNIDAFTWETLKGELHVDHTIVKKRQILHTIGSYFQSAHLAAVASIGIRSLGYASIALCRAYPDTLTDAAVKWGMGTLYTGKMLYRKVTEQETQREITQDGV